MALLKFSEWHNAVKAGVAVVGTFGAIIGIYMSVDAWAEDKIAAAEQRQLEQRIEDQVRNEIDHDKIVQSTRIATSTTNITIVELQLEQLEEDIDERTDAGRDPTARQQRSMERLTKLLEAYEEVQVDATKKLSKTTITTTTTETSQ